MSYIDDALKKAQGEKNERYGGYGDILPPAPPKVKRRHRWRLWGGGLGFLFCAAACFSIYYLYFGNSAAKPISRPPGDIASPAKTEVSSQAAPPEAAEPDVRAIPMAKHGLPEERIEHAKPEFPLQDKRPVHIEKNDAEIYEKALVLQQEGNYSQAALLYEKFLAANPRHVRGLNNLGVVYMSQGKDTQAVKMFRRAIDLNKKYADPHYNLACLHSKWNNAGPSVRYLKKAMSIDSGVAEWIKTDQDLNNVRSSLEFKNLMNER